MRFSFFGDMRVLSEELKEVLRNVSVAVSQTAKHNGRADVQCLAVLEPPASSASHLKRKCFSWNCLFSLCLWFEL